jgi:hypothetical protein
MVARENSSGEVYDVPDTKKRAHPSHDQSKGQRREKSGHKPNRSRTGLESMKKWIFPSYLTQLTNLGAHSEFNGIC